MRFAVVLVAIALLVSGCKKVGTKKDEVSGAIYRTETQARTYTYAERTQDVRSNMSVNVADDYRYAVYGSFEPTRFSVIYKADEVVVDDSRAIRSDLPTLSTAGVHPTWTIDPMAQMCSGAGQR